MKTNACVCHLYGTFNLRWQLVSSNKVVAFFVFTVLSNGKSSYKEAAAVQSRCRAKHVVLSFFKISSINDWIYCTPFVLYSARKCSHSNKLYDKRSQTPQCHQRIYKYILHYIFIDLLFFFFFAYNHLV